MSLYKVVFEMKDTTRIVFFANKFFECGGFASQNNSAIKHVIFYDENGNALDVQDPSSSQENTVYNVMLNIIFYQNKN